MALTLKARVFYPDGTEKASFKSLLSTLASSIENGLGVRVSNLETFIGCNLVLAASFPAPAAITKVTDYAVQGVTGSTPGAFNQGMTVSNGTVTVPVDGIYSIMFTANFQPTNTTPSRVNSYIYVNGVNRIFSSAYGEASTIRYTNCNVVAIYNLKKNDQIDVRVAAYDGTTNLVASTGSSFCVSLVSRSAV